MTRYFKQKMTRLRAALSVASMFLVALNSIPDEARAVEVPSGYYAEKVTSTTFASPIGLDIAQDGRIFIIQQDGTIRIVDKGKTLGAPFTKINTYNQDEHGLLGIALDPDFLSNHYIYIFYTTPKDQGYNNRISRLTEANNLMVPGSEKVLLNLQKIPDNDKWHNGGALHFGKDGKLYAAVGNHEDLSTKNREEGLKSHSQNLSLAFGKLLRINKDGSIPSDNPYVNRAGAFPAIWASGLRNPFSFGISPSTGQVLINDVGFETWEEVNEGKAGKNYGWPMYEGTAKAEGFQDPLFTFGHSQGNCSIMGGVFYEGTTKLYPSTFQGRYLISDYCGGWIRAYDPKNFSNPIALVTGGINAFVAMALGPDGMIYFLERNSNDVGTVKATNQGTLSRVGYTGTNAPRISIQPQDQTVVTGDKVSFSVDAAGANSFQWTRNGSNINGATGKVYTINSTSAADNGVKFAAIARNNDGVTVSFAATLTVTNNHLPVPVIIAKDSFESGDTFHAEAMATDQEDGNLPDSAFTWSVTFQHDEHAHPSVPSAKGRTLDFVAKSEHPDLANTWIQIHLTAVDSGGRSVTVTKDVFQGTALSSLTPTRAINRSGPFENNRSNGEDQKGDGNPITMLGIKHIKGLGVHAPSELVYNLAGKCSGQLLATVGVDDEAQAPADVIFVVYGDNKQLFRSQVLKKDSAPGDIHKIFVPIAGVKELKLVVEDNGNPDWDHADWGSIKVTGCSSIPTNPTPQNLVAGSVYSITSVGANKCLQMTNASTENGAKATVANCDESPTQKFTAVSAGTGLFQFKNQASGKCLDVVDASTANGALLQQWDCQPNNQQRMIVAPDAALTSTIIPSHSKICVDLDQTKVQQWGCHGGVNQNWKFKKL